MTDGWEVEAERMVAALPKMSAAVRAALLAVPRHRFVAEAYRADAYADSPLPIGRGDSTISAPHMVAFQLEWAELGGCQSVLEIGSGSGYLAALLAKAIGPDGFVHALEIDPDLAQASERLLTQLGYGGRVRVHNGDGRRGLVEAAPFDRILVSCAAPELLPAWKSQTVDGGLLIAPIGDAFSQRMIRWRRRGQDGSDELGPEVRFVPLVSAFPRHI